MLMRWCLDRGLDAIQSRTAETSPKGTPVCIMPKGPGFMPRNMIFLCPWPIAAQIGSVGLPGVLQRVVDVRHRRGKAQRFQLVAQPGGRTDQALAGGIGGVGRAGGNVRSFSVGHGSG